MITLSSKKSIIPIVSCVVSVVAAISFFTEYVRLSNIFGHEWDTAVLEMTENGGSQVGTVITIILLALNIFLQLTKPKAWSCFLCAIFLFFPIMLANNEYEYIIVNKYAGYYMLLFSAIVMTICWFIEFAWYIIRINRETKEHPNTKKSKIIKWAMIIISILFCLFIVFPAILFQCSKTEKMYVSSPDGAMFYTSVSGTEGVGDSALLKIGTEVEVIEVDSDSIWANVEKKLNGYSYHVEGYIRYSELSKTKPIAASDTDDIGTNSSEMTIDEAQTCEEFEIESEDD